ncbi:MAG TPA: hypothetical protein VGH87_27175 [Polyangiaceae bacterium]
MTKATLLAITTFVWTAGFAATGAFVYTVSKPLPKPVAVASMPQQRMPHTPPRGTIVLSPVEIVGSAPEAAPPAPVRATMLAAVKPKPPHVVHCSEWRPLEQGSASVQICE